MRWPVPEPEPVETAPLTRSPIRETVSTFLLIGHLVLTATVAASYVYFLILHGASRHGVLGVIVALALGIPTSFAIAGVVAIVLLPIVMVLDAIVEWPRRPGR